MKTSTVYSGLILFSLVALIVMFLSVTPVISLIPVGANYSDENTTSAPYYTPQSHDAYAGNVTEITISGYSKTQAWQGYYGNVTGTIQLADSANKVLYNWSLASPEGEVYAANHSSVTWDDIQCFNFTSTGNYTAGDCGDAQNAGGTSHCGMNLSQIETAYNITWDDVDGVNETFSLDGSHPQGSSLTHDLFYTANEQFTEGECLSTHLFNDVSKPEEGGFQEVLLWDPTNNVTVFTALLDEEDNRGFDGDYHDFEMLVLDNGHGVDQSPTVYYFYVELE